MRVAIVGGGIIGCAIARELSRRGASAVVLERTAIGAEASSAAAGILGAQIESRVGGAWTERFVEARAGYASWSEELRDESGVDVGYRVSGALRVALDEAELADLARDVAWQAEAGLRAEMVDAARARTIEPELADAIAGAAYLPDEAQVDPPSLVRAVSVAASRAGAEIRVGANARALRVAGGRCTGVDLEDDVIDADATVIAAGSWSSLVPGAGGAVPRVRPVRGQMVVLDQRPPRLATILTARAAYAVPRGDGRVLCGSTEELVGYQRGVTAAGVRSILDGALRIVPSLAAAPIATTWSGFRPWIDGDEPRIGATEVPGLFAATGHFRNGILLARLTAETIASAVLA